VTHSAPASDSLTTDRIAKVVADCAGLLALDPAGWELIKFTNNAVVTLPRAGAVLRIAGSPIVRARTAAVIAAAHWFEDHKIPAVRLWPDAPQPVSIGPHLVTVWQHVPGHGPRPIAADLAVILHAIHAVDDPHPAGIPAWSVAEGMRRRLRDSEGLPTEALDFLTTEVDEITDCLAELKIIPPLIPPGLIHGDAHLGNIISSPDGPVICDFDSTSIGPREWDLTPAAVGSLRFNYPTDVHAELVEFYGVDVTTWPGFPILRRLREFQLVVSVVPVLNANPALRPQWQHRFDTYRQHDDATPWTPYADAASS
jgi:Phosphotransferase enzyme family